MKLRIPNWRKVLALVAVAAAAVSAASRPSPSYAIAPNTGATAEVQRDAPRENYYIDPDGSVLQWQRYTPSGPGGPWCAVVLFPGGGYRSSAVKPCGQAASDLAAAGYLCFASDYRVDDPAYLILDQPAHFNGRRTGVAGPTPDIHDQMDDIRTAIRTARKDSQCNGIVFVVGSSAGATHTLFAAVTGAQGDDKPDGVVGLSGSYDGSDMTGFKVPIPPAVLSFTHDWESYVDVPIETFPRPSSIISIHNASPAWQSIANVPSTLLICSENDPMPTAQLNDMITALNTAGVPSFTDWPLLSDYQRNIVPGNGHGWDNWLVQCAPGSGTRVRDEVITFLNSLRYPRNLIK